MDKRINILSKIDHFIHSEIDEGNDFKWCMTTIYAIPRTEEKNNLWINLILIANSNPLTWLIGGDFNDICIQEEKLEGASVNLTRCLAFNERIQEYQLIDLGSIGPKFTWVRPRLNEYNHLFECLDCGLCNLDWRLHFPEAIVRVLHRIYFLDHHPLLFAVNGLEGSTSHVLPFRFEASCIIHKKNYFFCRKTRRRSESHINDLGHLKANLEIWDKDVFGNIKKRKRRILARLEGIPGKKKKKG